MPCDRSHRRAITASIAILALSAVATLYFCRHSPLPGQTNSAQRPSTDVETVRVRAENGDAAAQAKIGRLYVNGDGVTNDYSEAAKWFAKASAQGHPEGQFGLAELHQAGRGVQKDFTEALRLYRLAAEQEHSGAEYALAFLYEAGRGVKPDQKEATKWYERAALHGEALAQYDLGQRYDLGVGVAADKVEAFKWLSLAAEQGQPDAVERLKLVRKSLTADQLAQAKRQLVEMRKKSSKT